MTVGALSRSGQKDSPHRIADGARRDRPRSPLLRFLVVGAIVLLVAAVMDAWLVLVVVPQDIRSSQPVVINEAVLLSEGPYVGCFADLAGVGTVAHQDEAFLLSWYVVAPPNATPSCSLRSIVAVFGPGESVQANVTGSNLPVTIPTGQTRLVQVDFAPIDAPVWGSITVGVTETNP